LTDAAVLGAIGSCDGLTVLDGGCGEGYLSRDLAMRGATAFGIDTSGALVTAAEQEGERLGLRIKYQVASLEAIPYAEKQFDIVVCNHVISDVANPEAVLKEIGRVTKPGGKLVLLMLHPCFYTAHAERGDHGDLPVEVYFSARQIHQRFNVAGIESPVEVHMNFRPLECYMSLLTDSGYVITHLSEPHPTPEQLRQEWWRKNFVKPLFLLVVGKRC
jgi:ubiquinone/menaquinone biosynthesis C-methylase UbiE